MEDTSEWVRIALAMALMVTGFILLPAFFLWKDKREEEREAMAEREYQYVSSPDPAELSLHSSTETGPIR